MIARSVVGAGLALVMLVGPLPDEGSAEAVACGAPPAVQTITAATDAQVSAFVNQHSWDYVQRYRDPGRGSVGNHAGAHPTRDTAIAALTWAEFGRYSEAEDALAQVLDQQDLNSGSPDYGFFARELGGSAEHSETLLFFIGNFLIVALERHEEHLSPELVGRLRAAITPAARIASSAKLHAPATNQALLQSFLAARGGELSGNPTLQEAGRAKWNEMYDYTLANGFVEANSPNYAKVDLYTLGFLVDYVDDPCIRLQASEVRRMLWWSITSHYHLPTRQLAGPFSRALADEMATSLQGLHFSLYRETGGLAPEPPQATPDDEADQQNLHAVLATLFAPSWPLEWVRTALATPTTRGLQFRERTLATNTGFAQMTTFLTPDATIGSWSRSHNAVNGENRELIAHMTSTGELGYFTSRVVNPSPVKVRQVAVQERRNVAIAYVAETYKPGVDLTASYTLVWHGTAAQPPEISTSSPELGQTFWVDLMGTRTYIRFADFSPVADAPTLAVERPAEGTLEIVWTSHLPTTGADASGRNKVPSLLLGYGVRFEEHGADVDPALDIAPVSLVPEAGSFATLAWASPDGQLSSRFQHTRNSMVQTQSFDGVTIDPVPLQGTLPAAATVAAEFADGKLTIESIGSSAVALACEDGIVKVNATDPARGPLGCDEVDGVVVRTGGGHDDLDLTGFSGLASADVVTGAGNDTVDLGGLMSLKSSRVSAGAGVDRLSGSDAADVLLGGDGDDDIGGGPGNDHLDGSTGVDRLAGGAGKDRIEGGPGDNMLTGGAAADVVIGGSRNDTIDTAGDAAKDSVICRAGGDVVKADTIDTVATDCESVQRT